MARRPFAVQVNFSTSSTVYTFAVQVNFSTSSTVYIIDHSYGGKSCIVDIDINNIDINNIDTNNIDINNIDINNIDINKIDINNVLSQSIVYLQINLFFSYPVMSVFVENKR